MPSTLKSHIFQSWSDGIKKSKAKASPPKGWVGGIVWQRGFPRLHLEGRRWARPQISARGDLSWVVHDADLLGGRAFLGHTHFCWEVYLLKSFVAGCAYVLSHWYPTLIWFDVCVSRVLADTGEVWQVKRSFLKKHLLQNNKNKCIRLFMCLCNACI